MKTRAIASCCRLVFGAAVALTGLDYPISAQTARPPIDESQRVALSGNTLLPAGARDLGPADSSLVASRMMLVLKRSPAQEADFQQLLAQLQDKSSPNYHQWLTPAQFGERFGASSADIQSLKAWLQGHGFAVAPVRAAGNVLEFSGTVGQVNETFHASIHRVQVNERQHLASVGNPQIPAVLAPVIAGIAGLNDVFPKAENTRPVQAAYDRSGQSAKPRFTATSSSGGDLLYLGPLDAAAIYDTPNSLNPNYKGTHSYTGNGVTIAIVSDANIHTADVDSYRTFFGLPPGTPAVVVDGNDPGVDAFSGGDTQQALLDLEVAGALAPNARLMLYTAKDTTLISGVFLAMTRALDDNLADIVQVGFSSCEAELAASGNSFVQTEWSQAAMQGVTVVVGSGNSGAAGCDAANDVARFGTAVNGYASTPYNIAVGGTDFAALSSSRSIYVGSSGTALGYIPELPWNNSVAVGGNGLLANNTPFLNANGLTNVFATGGGGSNCENGSSSRSTCAAPLNQASHGYGKPSWQSAAGNLNIPQDTVRDLPDVSLMAGTGQYGAAWAMCGNDYDASGNLVADCAPGSSASAAIQGMGGTSAAASAFAGILALVSQSQGNRLGQANYVLYNLANQPGLYHTIFHDIQTGNNSVVCGNGSPQCGTNGFITGYDAGPAYDLATGLGSVDVGALVANWSKASFAPTTTVLTINGAPGPISVQHGTPLTYTITVSGTGSIPTGRAGIVANVDSPNNPTYGDNVGFAGPLNAHAVFQQVALDTPGGTFDAYGRYDGDLDFSASQSSGVQLIVTKEDSKLNLELYYRDPSGVHQSRTPSTSYPYGTYMSVDATPKGLSGAGIATGTVTFLDNQVPLATRTNNLNNVGFAEVPTYFWPVGVHSISASYGGDNSFNPSASPSPMSFTISQVATGLTVSVAPASLISGTATISGVVTPTVANSGASPSGTVTLTDSTNGASFGSATLTAAKDPQSGGSIATFTMTIDAGALAIGLNTFSASYAGDRNYASSSATTTLTRLARVASTLTLTAEPASLTNGNTLVSGLVTAASNAAGTPPGGTVTLVDTTNTAPLGTTTLVASGNSATFSMTVHASSLAAGANILTAAYPGDLNYTGSSAMVAVTLNPAQPVNSQFSISATDVTIAKPGQTKNNLSTITVRPAGGFTGQVNLSAALISGPDGAVAPPTVTLSAPSVAITGTSPSTATATIATTALAYAMQRQQQSPPGRSRWYEDGGAVLAGIILLGIPGRRRSWRAMTGLLLLGAVGLSAGCGVRLNKLVTGNTTAGTYIFSITGIDAATGQDTATGTMTVLVK